MQKIVFLLPPFFGHALPTIPIGEKLIAKGYEVHWVCALQKIEQMLPVGGHFHGISVPDAFNPEVYLLKNKAEKYGLDSVHQLYEESLVPLNRILYHAFLEVVTAVQPDLAIVDQQGFAGAMVCTQLNIPFATSVTAPAAIDRSATFPKVMEFEHEQILSLQKEVGIATDTVLICNSDLTLVYTLPTFVSNPQFNKGYQFVGPIIAPQKNTTAFPYHRLTKKKGIHTILVSLGSILAREPWFITMVVEALSDASRFQVVLVADPEARDTWPTNFIVQSFIPQQEVLRYIDSVVCHSGHNTVMESLSQGIPLMVLPMVNDQSHVATRVVDHGAGIRLKYRRVNSRIFKAKIEELLETPSYRDAAKKLQKDIEKANGVTSAVHHIEHQLNNTNEDNKESMVRIHS